jgi:RNA polymerase sigma factor (sigma-70 family)
MSTDQPVTELVTRARNGDKQAWDALVERYAPLIWSICRQHRLDGADAADVGQSVWLHLVDHLGSLRDPAALPGWLATTTRRECGRALRAARGPQAAGHLLDPETLPGQQVPTAEQELLAAERHAALRQAVRELPPDCQRLLSLLTADPPVPYAEISNQLGIPTGSIGPTRRRCLDKLRQSPAIAALIDAEHEDLRVAGDSHSRAGRAAVAATARASPGAQSQARRYRSLNVRYRTYRARHVEPPIRYNVTITVARESGQVPDPVAFVAATSHAAWRRSASIVSAHPADTIISVVTVDAPAGTQPRPSPAPSFLTCSSIRPSAESANRRYRASREGSASVRCLTWPWAAVPVTRT